MQLVIDECSTAASGEWISDCAGTAELVGFDDLISGGLDASVMLRFPAGIAGRYIGKELATPISVVGYTDITLSMKSFSRPLQAMQRPADALYALELANGIQYKIPVGSEFGPIDIPIDGFTLITRIRIVCLHTEADQVVISNVLAVVDEIPIDILEAVQLGIEAQRDRLFGEGIAIGIMTCSAGAGIVTVDGDWSWVEPYLVFKVVGGGFEEIHQAENVEGNVLTLGTMFAGRAMLHAYSAARVYVHFPVVVGSFDREILLPGVSLWYTSPTPSAKTSRFGKEVKCSKGADIFLRQDGLREAWRVTMDFEARSPELIAKITEACRAFLAGGTVWVHGKKLWFEWEEPAIDTEPVEGYDVIPRTAYTISIEIREDVWEREKLPSGQTTLTYLPVLPS